jgi:nanoRNase/pAp phosphatase (c-di-AMP/oligoRNAs hydrolase)
VALARAAALAKALKQRYPEKIITVRTDVKHSIFRALMKNDKDKS